MPGDSILLVEDNPDDEELTLRALRKSGVTSTVVVVHDGPEALDYLFATGAFSKRNALDTPRVVLLDLKLPKLSGMEVLKRLREDPRTRWVPVVVLTSSTEEHDIQQCYDLGANSYVRKPVEFDEFLEFIRNLGNYWLKLNERPPART
jgi:two-component system response regulator